MNLMGVVSAALVIGTVGLFVGLLLVGAAAKFHVNKDEREEKVRGLLPGNNCGGCGYAGCDALAAAIAAGEADVSSCPVGGISMAKAKKQNPGRTNKYFVNFFFIGKYTCPLRRPQSAASVQFFVPYGIYISNTACTSPTS